MTPRCRHLRPTPSPVADRVATSPSLVLASASPRRAELLARLGIVASVRPAELDETPFPDEPPHALVARLATAKAAAVAVPGRDDEVVLAADTEVVLDGRCLGKPRDRSDAAAMLASLAGATHEVVTGVAVQRGTSHHHIVVTTRVTFRPVSAAEIAWYLATGEAEGKAGGYALQGAAAVLVERIDGSDTNVIGLPLAETVVLLRQVGLDLPDPEPDMGPGPGRVPAPLQPPGAAIEPLTPATRRRIQDRLDELHMRCRPEAVGKVDRYYRSGRGYYPQSEAGTELDLFAISIATVDGRLYEVGDAAVAFPLHSISKVFAYGMALEDHGPDHVLERVGVEPSGDAFDALRFDRRHGRPFNPMVNAGALVTSSLLEGDGPAEQFDRALATLRTYAGREDLDVDAGTLRAEVATADGNRGLAYLMRSLGMLQGDVESVLRLYLQQCSVTVTSGDLAMMAATLANGGVNPVTTRRALPRTRVRDVLSVMYTCGMYDYAGHWAFDVGVPAKSSVSGGILAVIPGKMGIGVFSPGLDIHGNSVRGVQVCAELSDRLGVHVFATEAEDALLHPAEPGLPPGTP